MAYVLKNQFFGKQVSKWKALKKKCLPLPIKYGIDIRAYLLHSDRQKDIIQNFCAENGIEFKVV